MTTPRLDGRLLFHHHVVVFVDADGQLWMPAFIGRWLNALAPHIREIGLLMYESDTRSLLQDTRIEGSNITLHSLGPPGKTWDRLARMRRIADVCEAAALNADALLIRGITPRQWVVWKHTQVRKKAYLLVGELDRRPAAWSWSFASAYGWVMSRLRPGELRRMARADTLFMVNSPALVTSVEETLGVSAHFVPTNSLQRAEFSDLELRLISSPLRILFCGRVVVDKGIFELLDAMALLQRRGTVCVLDIVGPFEDAVRLELEQRIELLQLSGQVQMHGAVPFGHALFEYYQNADVFVLPTYHEGFPHVLWEAAAHCCPIVTTRVGGIPAMLRHEHHALLVPSQDSPAIADAVLQLLRNDELRSSLIVNAYRQAEAFTVEQCAYQLVHVLKQNRFDP